VAGVVHRRRIDSPLQIVDDNNVEVILLHPELVVGKLGAGESEEREEEE